MDHAFSELGQEPESARVWRFIVAGITSYHKFERTGALGDLGKAIGDFQQVVSLTADGHPNKPAYLTDLGGCFRDRFQHTGSLSDLEHAISHLQQAVSLTPDGHADKPGYLSNLGVSLETRFECTGSLSDLEYAIRHKQQAVSLIPDGHANKPGCLSNLGNSLESRFKRVGSLGDLEEAIKHKQQAVSSTPDGQADKPMYLNNLGNSFRIRFGRTGSLSDLEHAIQHLQQAVSLTPDGHADKPGYLSNLGVSLEARFGCTGSPSDLEYAIRHKQQAVLLTPDGHAGKPMYLNNLGVSFETRFKCTGSLSDLEQAIEHKKQAVLFTPDGHANKPGFLSNLGISLKSQFKHTGLLRDLEDAIKYLQQAVSLTPDGHADKSTYLNNLGNCFESRFGHTGSLSDVEHAITHKQQVVSLTPDGHANKPAHLNNLGNSFQSRFGCTGSLSDLEDAIKHQQQAVALTPDGHHHKPMYLNGLGNAFESRFGHAGLLSDLEDAIRHLQQALSLTPDGRANKPMYLSNLGISFQNRFWHTGSLNDLKDAVKHFQQAVLLTPDGHADKPTYLSNLGISFESQFGHTGLLSDLEGAIRHLQQAISLTPDGHASKPGRLSNLGTSFESRFSRSRSLNDLAEATSHFQLAATSNIGPVLLRCRASRDWARLEAKKDILSTLPAYRQAINLLPQVAWIGDPIGIRHSQLNKLGDIPREAAAFALDAGHPDLALEWLEQGRSVVWNQLLRLRAPVDNLRQAHPDICAEFTHVSHQLQRAATRGLSVDTSDDVRSIISLEEETQRHHRLAEKWNSLVEQIRLLPDFGGFLLPKKVSLLIKAASSGPVVVINVHQRRCDALVLDRRRDNVLHIPLERVHYEDLERMQESLRQYLANPYRAQRWGDRAGGLVPVAGGPRIVGILEYLYSNIVYPILHRLGMTTHQSDSEDLPRIWWCPTGPLTFFPLHAACCRTKNGDHGTFDYVVSSYTPTVNALLEARTRERSFNQLAGIAMINTPHQQSLPGAETEIKRIGNVLSGGSKQKFEILRDSQATGERVLAHMANSSWVHFASHAVQDEQEPTRSGFCLHDRRLTITNIIAKPLDHADFAFLSACETATGDRKASDEAIHITGAMLGAGYRNVIGTMWAIPDAVAPTIATRVYEILLAEGEPNSDRAAQALHAAVREIRDSSRDLFHYWVPFVHYGV